MFCLTIDSLTVSVHLTGKAHARHRNTRLIGVGVIITLFVWLFNLRFFLSSTSPLFIDRRNDKACGVNKNHGAPFNCHITLLFLEDLVRAADQISLTRLLLRGCHDLCSALALSNNYSLYVYFVN